jgi:magnesium transporter
MSIYLSRILGKPVWDVQGNNLGRCADISVAEVAKGFPPIRAIAITTPDRGDVNISAEHVAWISPSVILKTTNPPPYETRRDELWLKRQVLDRQIVDTEGRRLVRVNDLQFTRLGDNGRYCLTGADVGMRSLLRRLGVEGASARLAHLLRRELPQTVIPWQDVAPLEADAPIRLRVSRDKISQLHPADIAAIVAELDRPMGQALLKALDTETAADTMQEIEPELQVTILGALPPERAADVLEEMDPDDAADLLGDLLPDDRAKLLDLMEDEDATDIQKLLTYPADSAGGIMTTEYATIPLQLKAGEAVEYLRQSADAQEDEALYYAYIVDQDGKLKGVIALRDLVLAPADALLSEIMDDHPVTVEPLTPQTEVARMVAKYNVLAVPVVDSDNVMHGIVTVDDAIDAIIPTAWKKRLPRFF